MIRKRYGVFMGELRISPGLVYKLQHFLRGEGGGIKKSQEHKTRNEISFIYDEIG